MARREYENTGVNYCTDQTTRYTHVTENILKVLMLANIINIFLASSSKNNIIQPYYNILYVYMFIDIHVLICKNRSMAVKMCTFTGQNQF